MTPARKTARAKALARAIGFDLLGVAPARPLAGATYYKNWLAIGYGGSMNYLARDVETRADPRRLLPGACSVLCGAVRYRRADGWEPQQPGSLPVRAPGPSPLGRVAQYARGRDYHRVLRRLFDELLRRLRAEWQEPFEARVLVDTGPVLERELAALAGLGWIGRNTCLLNATHGSYLLLGEAVLTVELEPDAPIAERCGRCTRCIAACPTGALRGPGELDARRCLAYLTIEHRGPIGEEFHSAQGDWVYGCDICQQVCPYNARAPLGTQPDINAELLPAWLPLAELSRLRWSAHRRLTRGTAAGRAGARAWRRNAMIALANAPVPAAPAEAASAEAVRDSDPGGRAAAAAARTRRALSTGG